MAPGQDGGVPVDVFVDGSVRFGNWAAAAWYVAPDRWGAIGYREWNSMGVEADAIVLALEAIDGPVRIHSDCDGLVAVFDPDRSAAMIGAWRERGRHRILAAMDRVCELAAGRLVEAVYACGRGPDSRAESRLVDSVCEYATILLAASGRDHLVIGADDLLGFDLVGDRDLDDGFVEAAADRLLSLGILDPANPKDVQLRLQWRARAMQMVVGPRSKERRVPEAPPFPWLASHDAGGIESNGTR